MIPLMKSLTKTLVVFALLLGSSLTLIAQDYSAKAIPFSPFAVKVCAGDNIEYSFRARDLGTNGFDTDYEFFTNNPLVTVLPNGSNPLNGTIPNNTPYFFVDVIVHLDPSLPPGVYEVVMQLSCAGCPDPIKNAKLKLRIVEKPEVEIITPPGEVLCIGDAFNLKAKVTNNVEAFSYQWNTGDNTISTLINAPGIYEVTVTGLCGQTVKSVTITGGDEPQLIQQMCTNFGNALEFMVEADENGGGPLFFQWFENGMPIMNGGDFMITSPNPGESVLAVNNVTDTNHDGSEFTVEISNFCGSIVLGGCFAVPVDFVSVDARAAQEGILVEWSTATEVDNDHFTVERSLDGNHFEAIGQIAGAGNSLNLNTYQFLDTELNRLAGYSEVYYRVKQTDYDLDYTYTKVVSVALDQMQDLSTYISQVQASDFGLNIKYHSAQNGHLDLAVYNLNGQLIYRGAYYAEAGANEFTVSLPTLAEGIYLLEMANANHRQTEKFAKF